MIFADKAIAENSWPGQRPLQPSSWLCFRHVSQRPLYGSSTSLLGLTGKQVYQEACEYACWSGSIYWPTSPGSGERSCVSCDRHYRRSTVEQMREAMSLRGSELSEVMHLYIWSEEAE